jgi:hypothetical protein
MTMLKTISAALLAVSVLAAPVLAAESTKTTANAPVIKTTQAKTAVKTTDAKTIRGKTVQSTATQAKPAALNANAKMVKHHRKHLSYHHRHHSKMSALKAHSTVQAKTTFKTAPKVSLKPAASATKRG